MIIVIYVTVKSNIGIDLFYKIAFFDPLRCAHCKCFLKFLPVLLLYCAVDFSLVTLVVHCHPE